MARSPLLDEETGRDEETDVREPATASWARTQAAQLQSSLSPAWSLRLLCSRTESKANETRASTAIGLVTSTGGRVVTRRTWCQGQDKALVHVGSTRPLGTEILHHDHVAMMPRAGDSAVRPRTLAAPAEGSTVQPEDEDREGLSTCDTE